MSPTLAMIVNREESIQSFVPEKFYTVQLDSKIIALSERFSNKQDADALCAQCDGQDAVISKIESKRVTAAPPRLFDLTSLQREANKIFGFTAQQTLDLAQSLYEKQLITYPRTDSQYLTHDAEGKLHKLATSFYASLPFISGLRIQVNPSQVINDAKVSDHHAIIPTWKAAGANEKLPEHERILLTLIIVRMICALSPPCSRAKKINQMGWKAPWSTFRGGIGTKGSFDEEDMASIPEDLREGSVLPNVRASVKEGTTTPPKHFTEATILTAMENAGNAEMPDDAERKGIGTPATRAGILEKLVNEGFVERKGNGKAKSLIPTEKGVSLIAVLPEQLQSPLLTLKQIEKGEASPEGFLSEINDMITALVKDAHREPIADSLFPPSKNSVGKCPNCGAAVVEKEQGFFCENRACSFRLWKKNRMLMSGGKAPTREMIHTLLTEGQVHAKGLKSKNGKTYNALIVLDCAEDGSARISPVFNQ